MSKPIATQSKQLYRSGKWPMLVAAVIALLAFLYLGSTATAESARVLAPTRI